MIYSFVKTSSLISGICEEVLTDAMYEFPSKKGEKVLEVTKKYIENKLEKAFLSRLKSAS